MIVKIIEWSVKNRFMVILLALVAALAGARAMFDIPLDAVPDLSDVQVIVYTEYPGQSPRVVEDQATYPLASAMLGVPKAKAARGYSFFGFSLVYVIFEDGVDLYWARSRVLETLSFVAGRLPEGINPGLGPDASGVGWVYEYTLQDTAGKHDLQQLRSIQDWYLRHELAAVPGVAEVAGVGGFVKQYQVEVDPNRLAAYGISILKVKQAIKNSNQDAGGKLLEMGETEFMIRSRGYIKSLEDLESVAVGLGQDGAPVLLKDVADIHLGPELRRGLLDWNGQGETVGGIVVARFGENALEVVNNVKNKLRELEKGLPAGVKIVEAYDRSDLILRAVDSLKSKLTQEMAAVALVCVIFLLHVRSALAVALTLPLAILISFFIMRQLGINADIMSLGGIAIAVGVMVDASVVLVENAHKHLERDKGKKSSRDIILSAAQEAGPALFYSLLIITVSFLPVFSLGEQSGRLFKPLAYTKTFAMAVSCLLAITVTPVLMTFFIREEVFSSRISARRRRLIWAAATLGPPLGAVVWGVFAQLFGGGAPEWILPAALGVSLFAVLCLFRQNLISERKNPLSRFFLRLYPPILRLVLKKRKSAVLMSIIILSLTVFPLLRLGGEFMPPLNEGELLYMPTTLPGVSITKAREILQQTDRIIRSFPEVRHVLGKVGRADTATDPAPLSMIETMIALHPKIEYEKIQTTRFFSAWPKWLKINRRGQIISIME